MKFDIDFKGIEETKKRLLLVAQGIEKQTPNVLSIIGPLGAQFAQAIAPEYTGALKAGILNFPENNNTWLIISQQPMGDEIPTHILFEMGVYPNPRNPNSLRFMTQTKEFLDREFSQKLNVMISEIIEKSRNVM